MRAESDCPKSCFFTFECGVCVMNYAPPQNNRSLENSLASHAHEDVGTGMFVERQIVRR